jgi:putative ATP-grasp target RiPP
VVVAREPERFLDDPLAPPGGRFAVARPSISPEQDLPSPREVRPWGLRNLAAAGGPHDAAAIHHYCHREQVAVTANGRPVVDVHRDDRDAGDHPPSGEAGANGATADDHPARPWRF